MSHWLCAMQCKLRAQPETRTGCMSQRKKNDLHTVHNSAILLYKHSIKRISGRHWTILSGLTSGYNMTGHEQIKWTHEVLCMSRLNCKALLVCSLFFRAQFYFALYRELCYANLPQTLPSWFTSLLVGTGPEALIALHRFGKIRYSHGESNVRYIYIFTMQWNIITAQGTNKCTLHGEANNSICWLGGPLSSGTDKIMWIMALCVKSVPVQWRFEWDVKNTLKVHTWKEQPYFAAQKYFAVFLVSAYKHLYSMVLMTHRAQCLRGSGMARRQGCPLRRHEWCICML